MKLIIENWRKFVSEVKKFVCPPATQDLELNTKNRNSSIQAEHIQYGPLNLSDKEYWRRAAEHWNTEPAVAVKSRCFNCVAFDISPKMLECLPGPVSEPIEDKEGKLGYCWMHHFKCHSARTCYTWAAGGPIQDDRVSAQWSEKSLNENKEDLDIKIRKALVDEGGAAGMDALEKHTGASPREIKNEIADMEEVGQHPNGDYILEGGDVVIDEGKICPKGKAWAMRKYGKWSAYAAMGASKYCKDPNYGKGKKKKKKKNESLTKEGELKKWREENWVQSDGTPCGDKKAQKNPKRCKPKAKWAKMTKGEKAADNAKKKRGGKKGKQFVSATKKGKVTKGYTK